MGKSNRGQYGSSKASKPKKLHGKREKTAVSPPEASFHPSDIDFKAPPKDLNEEQAEADVAMTLALVLACVARIDAGELSLPLAEDVANVAVFFFLNYDVLTKKAGNGFTNMLNNCVQWATSGLWIALGVPVAIVGIITRSVLVIDVHPLKMRTRDKKGARINVGKEYVRRCHGLENAIELSMLYRDYIVALLYLNAIKRGKAASVVSFGVSATSFVVKHLTGLEFTDVLGIFMHPESFLAITGDVAKKAEKGKLICVATTRAVYVAADAAARAVLILFGVTDFVSDFHVQVFEGCADLLAILSEERSKRGKAWWAALSPAEKQAWSDRGRAAWDALSETEKQGYSDRGRAAWDALSETERLRRVTLMCDGRDDWWAGLSPEDHAAHCSAISSATREALEKMSPEAKAKLAATRRVNGKAQFAEGKCPGLAKKGDKRTAATKKKMSAARSKPGAKRIFCPGCCGYSVPVAGGALMRVHFGLASLPVTSKRCVPVEENVDGVPCSGLQVARNAVAAGYALALPATYTRAGDLKTQADRLKTWANWSK